MKTARVRENRLPSGVWMLLYYNISSYRPSSQGSWERPKYDYVVRRRVRWQRLSRNKARLAEAGRGLLNKDPGTIRKSRSVRHSAKQVFIASRKSRLKSPPKAIRRLAWWTGQKKALNSYFDRLQYMVGPFWHVDKSPPCLSKLLFVIKLSCWKFVRY